MKNLFLTIFLIPVILVVNSCEEKYLPNEKSLTIEFGSECGWCAGHEYIKITGQNAEHKVIIPCGENEGTTTNNSEISSAQWQELQNAFNFEEFLTLEYNECSVCVDGCDEILKITREGETHEIRYDPGLEIEEIKNLQVLLRELMVEFNDEN